MGLDLSQGKYVWFFDVDDYVELDLVEKNICIMESTEAEIVFFGFYAHIEATGTQDIVVHNERLIENNNELRKSYSSELFFTRHGLGFCCTKFYRKSFIDTHSLRFGEQRIQQDEAFNLQFYPLLERVYIAGGAWYHYNIRTSGNARSRYIEDRFEIILSVDAAFRRLLDVWAITEPSIIDAIDRRYLSGVRVVLVSNLTHSDCPLSIADRYKVIAEIAKHETTRSCINRLRGRGGSREDSIFQVLVLYKLTGLTMAYAWMRYLYNSFRQSHTVINRLRAWLKPGVVKGNDI